MSYMTNFLIWTEYLGGGRCWGNSSVFGAALSTDKRETASNCQFELRMADFSPLILHTASIQVLSSDFTELCFRSVHIFLVLFRKVYRVICIPLNGCPWTNTTRSVKLNRDGKFNSVCFYCRKLYQCAEELGYPSTITHFSVEERLYSA